MKWCFQFQKTDVLSIDVTAAWFSVPLVEEWHIFAGICSSSIFSSTNHTSRKNHQSQKTNYGGEVFLNVIECYSGLGTFRQRTIRQRTVRQGLFVKWTFRQRTFRQRTIRQRTVRPGEIITFSQWNKKILYIPNYILAGGDYVLAWVDIM